MSKNRGVVYIKPGVVEVQDIADPKFEDPRGRRISHGVILKVISTNICGSDQHMVRGRTSAPPGLVLGHEITGEVIEKGVDVEFIDIGDIVSVPFNVACGRCRTCRHGDTDVCHDRQSRIARLAPMAMSTWAAGSAARRDTSWCRTRTSTFSSSRTEPGPLENSRPHDADRHSSDRFSRGHSRGRRGRFQRLHCRMRSGRACGSSVVSILGAAVVMIGDTNKDRLAHAKAVGFEPIDLGRTRSLGELIESVLGEPVVDAFIDAVGFEAKGHDGGEQPAVVLNQAMDVTRYAGSIGISRTLCDRRSRFARCTSCERVAFAAFWSRMVKSPFVPYGQTPTLRYNRQLCKQSSTIVYRSRRSSMPQVIPLDEAVKGYAQFDKGAPVKFVIDPHGLVAHAA